MIRYDPFDREIQRDPYPTYDAMRRDEPVYFNEDGGYWALTRFDDVWDAVHDPATYSSAQGIFEAPRLP